MKLAASHVSIRRLAALSYHKLDIYIPRASVRWPSWPAAGEEGEIHGHKREPYNSYAHPSDIEEPVNHVHFHMTAKDEEEGVQLDNSHPSNIPEVRRVRQWVEK